LDAKVEKYFEKPCKKFEKSVLTLYREDYWMAGN
jgi:hypothetical protein